MNTATRPLAVGIQLPEIERPVRWPELRDMGLAIEDLGFDSIWVGDHLLYETPDGPVGAVGSVVASRRPRCYHDTGSARSARCSNQLPQSCHARQEGDHR